MPDLARLNALAAARALCNAHGLPLRFTASAGALSARAYESLILQTGCIPTRADSWHDLMNALVWLRFPQLKAGLNAAHGAAMRYESSAARGPRRDALTMLDESGVWVSSTDPMLLDLLQRQQWMALFWQQRARVLTAMRFVVIGHALLEKLLAPYPAMTGKCLFTAPGIAPEAALDGLTAPHSLCPLPLLGIPGWDAANAAASFYDNVGIFRPARQADRPR